jgi:HPt (histidine-containing phosphotransfer) domain-containing protein
MEFSGLKVPTPYDRHRILDNLGGDAELLAEIAEMLFGEAETGMRAVRSAIDKADAKALHIAAHSLKGAVSNFAAERATAAAEALERCGKVANLAAAEPLFAELSVAVDELVVALRRDFGSTD